MVRLAVPRGQLRQVRCTSISFFSRSITAVLTLLIMVGLFGSSADAQANQSAGQKKPKANKKAIRSKQPFSGLDRNRADDKPIIISDGFDGLRLKSDNVVALTLNNPLTLTSARVGWHDPGPNGNSTVRPNGSRLVRDTDNADAALFWDNLPGHYKVRYWSTGDVLFTITFIESNNRPHTVTAKTTNRADLTITTDQSDCVFKKTAGDPKVLEYRRGNDLVLGHINSVKFNNSGSDRPTPPSSLHINFLP